MNEYIAYILIWFGAYAIAGYRDADKERHKKEFGVIANYHQHENGWHIQTTLIWVAILTFAFLLGYLMTGLFYWKIFILGFNFFALDMWYYIWRLKYNKQKTFLPEHLNWFVLNNNPIRWIFGKYFSRNKFILAFTIQFIIIWGLIILL
ncbi:MAG: hypothetical protein B6D44_00125 [Ignavibacteriales bacterium UTCHB2]|jgi:hypothetical protein|nr:MAG: hypothetical protein B6D44_00125 [Ignavibacteriales bacterium UTCHB2]